MLIATAIISGLGLGSMYGLLALGFHVHPCSIADRKLRPRQPP